MTTIPAVLDRYTDYLRHERKLSNMSIWAYRSDLLKLNAYIGDKDIKQIKPSHLRQYIQQMSKEGLALATIRRRIHSFGTFWHWLVIEEITTEKITDKVDTPRKKHTVAGWLTVDELKRFVAVEGANPNHTLGFRLQAWLGLRRGEVLGMLVRDVSLEDGMIVIRKRKNGRDDVLPIPKELLGDFQREVTGMSPDALLFHGTMGGKWNPEEFSREFKQRCKAAGIRDGVTSRWLRHTFITHQVSNGTPLNAIRAITGHVDLQVFSKYVHADARVIGSVMSNHVLSS